MTKTKRETRIERILKVFPDKTAMEAGNLHSQVFQNVRGELRSRISEIRNRGLAKIDNAIQWKGQFYYVRDDKSVMTPVRKAQLIKSASSRCL